MRFEEDKLQLESIYNEMALSNLKKIGKWDDKKNRHGYDKASIGILSSPAGLKKLEKSFNNIGNWDFNLYFVKLPNAWKHAELGQVKMEELTSLLGIEVGKDFPVPDNDDITVFFTNNTAAEQVPLTPWTIAHRIGHAFSATFRRKGGTDNRIAYYDREISNALKSLLECYGVNQEMANDRSGSMYRSQLRDSTHYFMRDIYQKIGKFRSARMGKLTRPQEFYYEAFAYWLLHDGNLELGSAPESLMSSNKKAWGNSTGSSYGLKDKDRADEVIEYELKPILEQMFDYYIGSHIGTVSIM